MDSGREVEFNARQHPHFDYGYAVRSHGSQGQTAERVLIRMDAEQAPGELVNSCIAYVFFAHIQISSCRRIGTGSQDRRRRLLNLVWVDRG